MTVIIAIFQLNTFRNLVVIYYQERDPNVLIIHKIRNEEFRDFRNIFTLRKAYTFFESFKISEIVVIVSEM